MSDKYTVEDYKKMIDDFCIYKGYTDKQRAFLMKPYIYEKDLFYLNVKEYVDLIIEDMCGKTKSMQYLIENISYMNQFFEWCVINGYTFINPFVEFDALSQKTLINILIENKDIKVLYKEDMRNIVSGIEYNKNYCGMLVYGFFEGIRNAKEFTNIKISDIDFDKNTIQFKNRLFYGSELLFSYINGYIREDEYTKVRISKGNVLLDSLGLISIDGLLIKSKIFKNTNIEEYVESFDEGNKLVIQKIITKDVRSTIPRLLSVSGSHGSKYNDINIDLLHKSGFIDFARRQLYNYNDVEFCRIFTEYNDRKSDEWCKILQEIAENFGDNLRGSDVRKIYRPYIMSSRYYK
jgi:hypothetical protein